jgi:hypothetical protein
MSLILKKIVRKTNINGKSKMEFDIFKKNNKKITEISGNINNTGAVKIKKFKQVPIIKGPNKFTLNIHQIKDIMNIDKITHTKKESNKKGKNIVNINVKRTKSVKKEKKVIKSKDSKDYKSVKKEKKMDKSKGSKGSKNSKSVKKEKKEEKKKKVVKSKGPKTNKKTIKNNLEK